MWEVEDYKRGSFRDVGGPWEALRHWDLQNGPTRWEEQKEVGQRLEGVQLTGSDSYRANITALARCGEWEGQTADTSIFFVLKKNAGSVRGCGGVRVPQVCSTRSSGKAVTAHSSVGRALGLWNSSLRRTW